MKKEDIYINLPNTRTEKSSSFARFVDSEFWMPLSAFAIYRLTLTIRHFLKTYILSWVEHTAMSPWSLCTWGFYSHIFLSVMIVAREHSPVLISFGCVRRETKARSFLARNLTSWICTLLLCDWSVQQSANKPQTQKEKNVVRLWAAVSLGKHCVTSQKTPTEETIYGSNCSLVSPN